MLLQCRNPYTEPVVTANAINYKIVFSRGNTTTDI